MPTTPAPAGFTTASDQLLHILHWTNLATAPTCNYNHSGFGSGGIPLRKLVYLVASTLDGFIAEASRQDPSGTVFELTGDHAQPLMDEYPEMVPHHIRPLVGMGEDVASKHFDTVLEGRVS